MSGGMKCRFMGARAAFGRQKATHEMPVGSLSGEQRERLHASTENIVLIGMPGCGKTTVGRLVAGEAGRVFIDTDERIMEKAGMGIREIFAKYGEAYFRDLESEVVAECSRQCGAVIATGGGTPLRAENRLLLRQNGRVFLLNRDIEKLSRDGRPLSASLEALQIMQRERGPVYTACADETADNNGSPELAAAAILKMINNTIPR